MSTRRSKFEIYVDVLIEIQSGNTKPTKIMYGANLSYKPLQKILISLVEQGLVNKKDGDKNDRRTKKEFFLTSKGGNVVKYYRQVKKLVEIDGRNEPGR